MATTLTVEVDPSTIVQVTSIDSVTATLPGGDEVLVEMVGNIRVTNLNRGKSVLKKELFAWLESSIMTARFGISTVQVSFTKCGRFAMVISRSKPGTFGLRLATLDPHHQLSTYLLGVSFSLESALLHSAARIKQIDDDMDMVDSTFKHGDVIMVDHLGYSHVAVYDAVNQVFYELIGDVDSGKDAFLAQANMAHSAAMDLHQKVKEATTTQLRAALDLFKRPERLVQTTLISQLTSEATTEGSQITSITAELTTVSPAPGALESSSSATSVPSVTLSDTTSTGSTATVTLEKSNDSVTVTTSLSVPVPEHPAPLPNTPSIAPRPVFELEVNPGTPTNSNFIRHRHSRSADRSSRKTAHIDATDLSRSADHLSGTPEEPMEPVFVNDELNSSMRAHRRIHLGGSLAMSSSSTSSWGSSAYRSPEVAQRVARILASSGHILSMSDADLTPFPMEDVGTPRYDPTSHLQKATRHLRQLAESTDAVDLSDLLDEENASSGFTSAGTDASIQPDDMCPAMAYGFPSHSIAEVMATPKDIFLTRDPLLNKRVQYYANALPPDVVVSRARSAVGSPGWNPITRNCEHFATWAKTGKTVSTQVYEIGSNTAILGASSLQTFITLAFIGLVSLWFIGRFVVQGNSILETMENAFSWLLKIGVLVSSIVFAVGIFIHWQNGTGADFDDWVISQQNSAQQEQNSSN